MKTHDGKRILIVNADDLGMSPGVNAGIIETHERGIVTSASLMVRRAAAESAAHLTRRHPELSVGLHIDLGDWELRDGDWHLRDRVVDSQDPATVAREVEDQLMRFHRLMGRDPTHLDSHQHVHLDEPARSVVVDRGQRLGVPVRGVSGHVAARGDFYGQDGRGTPCLHAIGVERLIEIISGLPEGVTELGCHPGDPVGLRDAYGFERRIEMETLCDPRVRDALRRQGVALESYSSIHLARETAWTSP